jgi:HK97 family phage portal protein
VIFESLGQLGSHLERTGAQLEVVDPGVPLIDAGGTLDHTAIWKSQPSVRKVVDFIARNHAAIPRNLYRRVSDTERERVTDHPIARMLSRPNGTPAMTAFRFVHALTVDYCLQDRWCAQLATDSGSYELHRVPARKVRFKANGYDEVEAVKVFVDGRWREYDPKDFVLDHGYAHSGANGTSPMETLAAIIAEQNEAVDYRRDLWKRGARVGGFITRDKEWSSDKARNRFTRDFREYQRGGSKAGAWALLEDGMTPHAATQVKPVDLADLQGRQLSDVEVASSFHIAPELVGAREGTFSNIESFRKALYGPALGPIISAFDQALNAALTADTDLYIEANVEAMLRGTFEERLQSMQSSIGAPWLTRNEGRALVNRPPVDGGDELVVPLNVLVGGQANPRDSAPKSDPVARLEPPASVGRRHKSRTVRLKARADETADAKVQQVLVAFFDRQGAAVLSALGADVDDWWDGERWDRELSDDLYALAVTTSSEVGRRSAEALGFDGDEYDVDRTLAFLRSVADSRAGMVNATTRDAVAAAVEADDEGPADVFTDAQENRAPVSAAALVTTFSAFATVESAQQLVGTRAEKTWIATSRNPRASHAAMNGETVGLSETFSNGMEWPGDPAGGADEVAGCLCDLEISF